MITFWIWLIKASLGLAFTHFLYRIFIRKHTKFQLNRCFFLFCISLSIIGPFLNVSVPISQETRIAQGIVYLENMDAEWNELAHQEMALDEPSVASTLPFFSWQTSLKIVYWAGFMLCALYILGSWIKLSFLIYKTPKYQDGGFFWMASPNEHTFSAFHYIFSGSKLDMLQEKERQLVIEHEKIHAREWHSLDILFLDIINVVFWFHPLKNRIKNDLKELHECIADATVAKDRHAYSRLILSLNQGTQLPLPIHAFAYSPIKHRIHMLLKKPTLSLRYLWIPGMSAFTFLLFLACDFSVSPVSQKQELEYQPVHELTQEPVNEGFIYPLDKSMIISGYGMRMHPIFKEKRMHTGFDFSAKMGTPVKASADGTITISKISDAGHGTRVEIDHGSGTTTFYSHLSETKVEVGQKVKQGEIIALSGNSGMSKGPHLHFEIKENGNHIDPFKYLKQPKKQDPPSFIYPMQGDKTSSYGMRMHPVQKKRTMHFGVDIKAPLGTPVKASAAGEVSLVLTAEGGYGKQVEITHTGGYVSKYAHLSEIKVSKGQKLSQGDVLGLCGNSGASQEPHLHFEIMKDGKKIDPEKHLK